jgi:hypothetical protein
MSQHPRGNGRGPARRPRYPISRFALVVAIGLVASLVLQALFPDLGTLARLSILLIVAALISLGVSFWQQKRRSR